MRTWAMGALALAVMAACMAPPTPTSPPKPIVAPTATAGPVTVLTAVPTVASPAAPPTSEAPKPVASVAVSQPTAAAAAAPIVPAAKPTIAMARGTVALRRADGTTKDIRVEIADDDTTRARGLMFRPTMPEDDGMAFVFPNDVQAAFWMQNTLIPLSIAFVGADGTIVDIRDMQPQSTELHQPRAPYRWALEVNQGFFGRNTVKIGDRAELRRG